MSLEGASKKNNDLCYFWGKGWVECVQILNAYTRFLVDPGNIHACVREKVKLRVNIWATLWWKQSCRVFNQGFSKDRLPSFGLQTRNDLVTAESFCLCSSVPSYHRLARPSVFPARDWAERVPSTNLYLRKAETGRKFWGQVCVHSKENLLNSVPLPQGVIHTHI